MSQQPAPRPLGTPSDPAADIKFVNDTIQKHLEKSLTKEGNSHRPRSQSAFPTELNLPHLGFLQIAPPSSSPTRSSSPTPPLASGSGPSSAQVGPSAPAGPPSPGCAAPPAPPPPRVGPSTRPATPRRPSQASRRWSRSSVPRARRRRTGWAASSRRWDGACSARSAGARSDCGRAGGRPRTL